MGGGRRKFPRTLEKKQEPNDSWFPGGGASSHEVRLPFLPDQKSPNEMDLSNVSSDEIRAEIERQEIMLEKFGKSFPHVLTGTLADLTTVEEKASNQMAVHRKAIEWLEFELASRFEISPTVEIRSETDTESKE
jgi:hypothetical protein